MYYYMRNVFRRILNKYTIHVDFNKHRTPTLGRWTIHDNPTIAMRKADMTNEDHCGTCDKMRYDYIEKKGHDDKDKSQQKHI